MTKKTGKKAASDAAKVLSDPKSTSAEKSAAGAALTQIAHSISNIQGMNQQIATASEEQSAASEEINQSIAHVDNMARQTAEAMSEAARAVSDLAAQAQGLTDLILDLKNA